MIPRAHVVEWREHAPWPSDEQVAQDLVITRAVVELFGQPAVRTALAFRGGTALAKLHLDPPPRYSEDIDLVQLRPEPIGATLDAMREVLDPWLGTPVWKRSHARVKLIWRFSLGPGTASRRRLKVEINTREHAPVFGLVHRTLTVDSRWFGGSAQVTTYQLEELLATKLRALYQRKKGRDLFDLGHALRRTDVDASRVVVCFAEYLRRAGHSVSREGFEANLEAKIKDRDFLADVVPLVAAGTELDLALAARRVVEKLISKIP